MLLQSFLVFKIMIISFKLIIPGGPLQLQSPQYKIFSMYIYMYISMYIYIYVYIYPNFHFNF